MRNLLLTGLTVLTLSAVLIACKPAQKTSDAVKETATATKAAINDAADKTVNDKNLDVNAELDTWFETKFMEGVHRYPQYLAQLGIKKRMDEWNDPSRAFALEQLDQTRQNLDELKASFNPDDLDESHALSYRLYVEQAEDELDSAKWWHHRYSFNQMFGTHASVPTFLINNHRIDNVEDAENYVKRLNSIDDYLGGVVKNSKASADKGIMPPKFVFGHVIRTSENILKGAPFDDSEELNLVLADFQKKVEKLGLDDDKKEALFTSAIEALQSSMKPAYDNLIAEMERQESIATEDDGAWKLPEGADFYAYRLKAMTTTDLSASEIHDLGLAEVARIHKEMQAIMNDVGFEGSLQDFFKYLQSDPKFIYEDSDAGREAYLTEATRIIDVMKGNLDEVFLSKPKADLEVRRVEAFREKAGSKAFYNRPAPDGSRPGYYYANLYKIEDMPKYQMEALAYHEGIPGHHMQIAMAQELEGVPKFRKFGGYTAYTEGWGLYSEYLPKEMGFYKDPYSDFGRLAMEIWRAARLVVDTGLHDKKWTRQQAIDYLTTNTPNPENDCIKAIERYIVMPGQATAYKIGMLKIQELRADAKKRLGDKFDIREYHAVVLDSGPVPLSILEERVNDWVVSKG